MLIRVLIENVLEGMKNNIYGQKWIYRLSDNTNKVTISTIKEYVATEYGIKPEYQTYYASIDGTNGSIDELYDSSTLDPNTEEIYMVYNKKPA